MLGILSSSVVALLLVLPAAPVLGADASASPGSTPSTAVSLQGTTWRLTDARVSGSFDPVPGEVVATLVLSETPAGIHAGGSGGCNQWYSDYTLAGDSLSFGQIDLEGNVCTGTSGTVETAYMADLLKVASWATDGTTLTLSADDGQPILAYTGHAGPSLIGAWVVTAYMDETGSLVAYEPHDMVVYFDMARLSASAECDADGAANVSDGPLLVDGTTLIIGTLEQYLKDCVQPEFLAREGALIADLEASTTVRTGADGEIELLDPAGAIRLSMVPQGPVTLQL